VLVTEGHDDTVFESKELRDCKALNETAALRDSTEVEGDDVVLFVAIAV
jgi:hypothetical protein